MATRFLWPEFWWVPSGTAGRISPPTSRPLLGLPSRLWRRRSIPRCGRLAFSRQTRSERSSDDGRPRADEDRVAQSVAQSPWNPADGARFGIGSDLAADF